MIKKIFAFILAAMMTISCFIFSVNAESVVPTNTTTTNETDNSNNKEIKPVPKKSVVIKSTKKSGTYGNKVVVKIKKTKGSKVYYTTTGEKPTTKSKVYKKKIVIEKSSTLRLLCTKKNYKSKYVKYKYIINKRPISFKYKTLTSGVFESRGGRKHKGFDILAAKGTKIVAIADGKVICSDYEGSHGHVVKIKHKDGKVSLYSHLLNRKVKKGQKVKAGKVIGKVGKSGNASTYHLHYELHNKNGDPVCTFKYKKYACVWGNLKVNPDYVGNNCKKNGVWYCDGCHHKRSK